MKRLIETDFPFEKIDPVAELESWRKEINRPIYHIHKWWANRLGTVFRAILLGVCSGVDDDLWGNFYKKNKIKEKIILDPFMGSGTTLGECAKLGIKSIGNDINPISSFIVKQSLTKIERNKLEETFEQIRKDVQCLISKYYKTIDPIDKGTCDALYYFWVKVVKTGNGEEIPLFRNYIFSKNAYPKRKPIAQILCSKCWGINQGRYDAREITCENCGHIFDPQVGPSKGQYVVDGSGKKWKIKELILSKKTPPAHRLYAIMALSKDGRKYYTSPSKYDHDLYEKASKDLDNSDLPIPNMPVRQGHNTNQVIGYNYLNWKQFFNDRQLLCLGILLERILQITDISVREHFLCLFSGALEFNNLFCSFKGEGTGAVRHMFSNHILKPERTPLENNVWGTSKSSGTFSSLFKSRLLRAKEYLDFPFEIAKSQNGGRNTSRKIYCNEPINIQVTGNYRDFIKQKNSALVLNGDSAKLPIPDGIVDAVVTDPPYFDFVHYSELSDFFFAWLSPVLKKEYSFFKKDNSGSQGEVQNKCPIKFSQNLCLVFEECFRTLKDNGLLIFSFHHSTPEAWLSIYNAITNPGFIIVAAHPVKAEMSVGSPKSSAKDPINIDAILVCKKSKAKHLEIDVWETSEEKLKNLCDRFTSVNRKLTNNDKRVILASQILVNSSIANLPSSAVDKLLCRVYRDEDFLAADEKDPPLVHSWASPDYWQGI